MKTGVKNGNISLPVSLDFPVSFSKSDSWFDQHISSRKKSSLPFLEKEELYWNDDWILWLLLLCNRSFFFNWSLCVRHSNFFIFILFRASISPWPHLLSNFSSSHLLTIFYLLIVSPTLQRKLLLFSSWSTLPFVWLLIIKSSRSSSWPTSQTSQQVVNVVAPKRSLWDMRRAKSFWFGDKPIFKSPAKSSSLSSFVFKKPSLTNMIKHDYLYVIPMLVLMVKSERSVFPEYGYYSYHPAYDHDLPPDRPLPAKIPFGMPLGGYSMEGRGPPFGLVAFYFEAYGHRFDFNNPWNMFLLRQLLRLSSEITAKFLPVDHSISHSLSPFNLLTTKLVSKFIPVDNSLMDGPLIWNKWSNNIIYTVFCITTNQEGYYYF